VNRFRWLCWAAGVLLNPYIPDRPPEVAWLLNVAGGEHLTISDVSASSERIARRYATESRIPTVLPTPQNPDWWASRQTAFAQLADRFCAPIFHGNYLRLIVKPRDIEAPQMMDPDLAEFQMEAQRTAERNEPRMVCEINTGGMIWGHSTAVNEFKTLARSACQMLPSEFLAGIGPCLFPSHIFAAHTSVEPTWWRWGLVMWGLCPEGFVLHPAEDSLTPRLVSRASPEMTAASVCEHLASVPHAFQAVQHFRRTLAERNPWLTLEDRQAAVLAVQAAYHPPPVEQVGEDREQADHDLWLSERQRTLVIEMLEMGAVGGTKRVKTADVVRRCAPRDDPDNYKRDFAQLKELKITDSSPGRGGGVWLTAFGKATAQRLGG
jgi:hypothetical protein